MGLIPPNEEEHDMLEIDDNFRMTMDEILDKKMFTHYVLSKSEQNNIRRGFVLGFNFARLGHKSRRIK